MKESALLKVDNKPLPAYPGRGSAPLVSWSWHRGESWVILGDNGSGKTHFSELLASEMEGITEIVSFEELEEILEEQIRQDDSEYTGKIDTGTPLYSFLGLSSASALPDDAPPLPRGLGRGPRIGAEGSLHRRDKKITDLQGHAQKAGSPDSG